MNARPARVDRRALRRRDPAALATILVGQLVAYRCSTIYAPTTTRLDAFVRDEVLPRLREQLDIRAVLVDAWDKKQGPTVRQLVDAMRTQLELEPEAADLKPLAALESALRRAERRSDRPILVVLYRLEELLDDRRDPAEVARFVDALARMAQLPMAGLHLVLGVKEEDLGAFRELLRGRWRLLANDIRIRPGGKKWLLSLPLAFVAYVSTKTAEVAVVASACAGTGAAVGAVAGAQLCDQREALESCRAENEELRRAPPRPAPDPKPAPPPVEEPAGSSSGDTTGAPSTDASTTDESMTDGATTDLAPPVAPGPPDLCAPARRDGECAACVRERCCADLQACKKPRWRACVLKGRIGQDDCTPETIEKECRKLALCALEYKCRQGCFNN